MTLTAGPVTAFPERETDMSSWLARVTCPNNGGVHSGVTFSLRLQYSGPGAEGAESLPAVSVLAPACYPPNNNNNTNRSNTKPCSNHAEMGGWTRSKSH